MKKEIVMDVKKLLILIGFILILQIPIILMMGH